MKAIRVYGPKDARFEEVPTPVPGSEDVLVRVRAVGVCRTDLEIYDGIAFFIRTGRTPLPFIPGHEWSGEVVAVGSAVKEFSVGERVAGECSVGCRGCRNCQRGQYHQCLNKTETGILGRSGAFAEYIAFPRQFLHKLGSMSFEAGACIEPTGIALYATKLAAVTPADTVVVFGAGPIGLLAVQTARAYGARQVILAGTRDRRLAAGQETGADICVNVRRESVVDVVRQATDGQMASVVIEAVGQAAVWPDVVGVIAPMGRIAMTGLTGGQTYAVDFDPIVINSVTVYGSVGAPGLWPEVIDLLRRGVVRTEPLISHRVPLAEFSRAVETARNGDGTALKVIVTV